MKSFHTLALAIGFGTMANASALGLSDTNSGVYLGIASWNRRSAGGFVGAEPFRFDCALLWRPFSNAGLIELNYPATKYLAKVKMTGPDGKPVPKTALGNSLGSHFDQVRRFEDAFHGWNVGSVDADGPYDSRDEGFSGPMLPAPAEMFQIEKPGLYTMEIQMQMFRVIRGTNLWTRQLIRFAPVSLKIEKPAKATQ